MLELPIAALVARDLTRQQFAPAPRARRVTAPPAPAPRAPVRRASARLLRVLAERVEPAPRCAVQA